MSTALSLDMLAESWWSLSVDAGWQRVLRDICSTAAFQTLFAWCDLLDSGRIAPLLLSLHPFSRSSFAAEWSGPQTANSASTAKTCVNGHGRSYRRLSEPAPAPA